MSRTKLQLLKVYSCQVELSCEILCLVIVYNDAHFCSLCRVEVSTHAYESLGQG